MHTQGLGKLAHGRRSIISSRYFFIYEPIKKGDTRMNGEEVLKLIDAGFTADEIRKMSETKTDPEPAPESGEQNKTDSPHESEVDTGNIASEFMDSIKKSIEDISTQVKALQEANIKNAVETKTDTMSAADVVKSFMENS